MDDNVELIDLMSGGCGCGCEGAGISFGNALPYLQDEARGRDSAEEINEQVGGGLSHTICEA